jgi:hypothetical protein
MIPHKLKPTADDLIRLKKNDQARKARKARLTARRRHISQLARREAMLGQPT